MSAKLNERYFGDLFASNSSVKSLFPSGERVFVAREFKTSLGVPDYVLLNGDDYAQLKRFAKCHQGIRMSGKYAAVLSYVAKNTKVNVSDLQTILNRRKNEILSYLHELESWGVVVINSESDVTYNEDFSFPSIHSIAVELKLSSWEKALWQAIRNKNQFSSSYVIMPSDKLDLLSSKVDYFKSNYVSTAVFDVNSMQLTPIHSYTNRMTPSNRYYLELLDSLMNNINSFSAYSFSA